MSKLVRESIDFERGGDTRRSMGVDKWDKIKRKYGEEDLRMLLLAACKAGNVTDIKYLVETQDLSLEKLNLDVPMASASEVGHLDVVKYLVENGANISEITYGLDSASEEGHLDIVKYLVEHGADIDAFGGSSLELAVRNGHLDIVKYLVEHGADIDNVDRIQIEDARENGYSDVADYLETKKMESNE